MKRLQMVDDLTQAYGHSMLVLYKFISFDRKSESFLLHAFTRFWAGGCIQKRLANYLEIKACQLREFYFFSHLFFFFLMKTFI